MLKHLALNDNTTATILDALAHMPAEQASDLRSEIKSLEPTRIVVYLDAARPGIVTTSHSLVGIDVLMHHGVESRLVTIQLGDIQQIITDYTNAKKAERRDMLEADRQDVMRVLSGLSAEPTEAQLEEALTYIATITRCYLEETETD